MPNINDSTNKIRTKTVEFSRFAPDVIPLESGMLSVCRNAVPNAAGHYGPARSLRQLSVNTLSDLAPVTRVMGSIGSFTDPDTARSTLFVGGFQSEGNLCRLFSYDDRSRQWSNATRSAGPYSISPTRHVRFAQFGNDMFASVGTSSRLQVMNVVTGGTFQDVTGSPRANDIAVVREFLVAINFRRGSDAFFDSVAWSALGNPRNWPAAGTQDASLVSSGLAQIPGGGRLQRIIPGVGGSDAMIVAENRIWRMTFVGPPSIWQFDVAVFDQGTRIPGSVAATNETLFFFGRDGFQMFNGAQTSPIGSGIIDRSWLDGTDLSVQTTADGGFQSALNATVDTERSLYVLSYPTAQTSVFQALLTEADEPITTEDDQTLDVDLTEGRNDALLLYNYRTGNWGYLQVELDAVGMVDTQRTTVDNPVLVAIGPDNALSTFTGPTLEAEFAGPEFVANGAMRETVRKALPGTDASNAKMSYYIRDVLSEDARLTQERSIDSDGYAPAEETGATARYWRARMRIPAGESWTFALGMHVELIDWGQGGVL